jgi:hypothetical protein
MCPFPEYTNLADGIFNIATKICRTAVPPDLGPKGRVPAEGYLPNLWDHQLLYMHSAGAVAPVAPKVELS